MFHNCHVEVLEGQVILCRKAEFNTGRGSRGQDSASAGWWHQWNGWTNLIWLVVWNINFIFPYIGNNHPNWLIFFRGVQITNQWLIGMRDLFWHRLWEILLGGEWLPSMNYFPMTIGNGIIIPIDEQKYFSEGWPNHQPGLVTTQCSRLGAKTAAETRSGQRFDAAHVQSKQAPNWAQRLFYPEENGAFHRHGGVPNSWMVYDGKIPRNGYND